MWEQFAGVMGWGVAALAGVYCLCLRSEVKHLRATQTSVRVAVREQQQVLTACESRLDAGHGPDAGRPHLRLFRGHGE